MGKKKNKPLIRPWCWYCEREFEDEKVLMQHQKAKHFKCGMCPRRLNTAGGLAVHIQQVHKLEPENLPRIDNALPGRDGYEVEIFGMEGIPAPDVADYKRRKEIELGLNPGSISQPPPKRAKTENRPLTEEELRAQLEAHKALMGGSAMVGIEGGGGGQEESKSVYGAFATTYAAPPQVAPTPPVPYATPPVGFPPGASPPIPGMPPFAPPFLPPGVTPPPGFRPPFPPPPGMPGAPPIPGAVPPFPPPVPGQFPPGPPGAIRPPFPPPPGFVPGMPLPPGVPPMVPPPGMSPMSAHAPPSFVPASSSSSGGVPGVPHPQQVPGGAGFPGQGGQGQGLPGGGQGGQGGLGQGQGQQGQGGGHGGGGGDGGQGQGERGRERGPPPELKLPNPALVQTNPEFKKPTELKWADANFSPEEHRAIHPKYYYAAKGLGEQGQEVDSAYAEEPRGKKRARAEDFL